MRSLDAAFTNSSPDATAQGDVAASHSGSSLETTAVKLQTTPTGGESGEHSAYGRRLMSAGYKGFLQGTLAGAGLYGFFGLAIGAMIALPAMAVPSLGVAALWLVPAAAGVGVLKGASTFGNIASVAAISAEAADLQEQRRYLLDRYYDLPDGPEGDKQAEIIKQELANLNHSEKPRHMFHWKTVAICAAVGALAAFAFTGPLVGLLEHGPILSALETVAHTFHLGGLFGATGAITAVGTAIGTAFGALAGATIGVDRQYIRGWFDGAEKLLHDDSHSRDAAVARIQQIDRLKIAAAADKETKLILERGGSLRAEQPQATAPAVWTPPPTTELDRPATKIAAMHYEQPMLAPTQAINAPAI